MPLIMQFVVGCLSLTILCIGNVQASLILPDHLRGPAEILHQVCIAEAGMSPEILARSRTGTLPDDREMQCYIHCMFDKVGLYDEEGNVDMDTISHLVPPDFKAKLDVVTAHCKTIHGADQCETAFKTVACYLEVDPDVDISHWFDKERNQS